MFYFGNIAHVLMEALQQWRDQSLPKFAFFTRPFVPALPLRSNISRNTAEWKAKIDAHDRMHDERAFSLSTFLF